MDRSLQKRVENLEHRLHNSNGERLQQLRDMFKHIDEGTKPPTDFFTGAHSGLAVLFE